MKKLAILLLAAAFCLPCLPESGQAMAAPGASAVKASENAAATPFKRKKNKKHRRPRTTAYQRTQSGKQHFRR